MPCTSKLQRDADILRAYQGTAEPLEEVGRAEIHPLYPKNANPDAFLQHQHSPSPCSVFLKVELQCQQVLLNAPAPGIAGSLEFSSAAQPSYSRDGVRWSLVVPLQSVTTALVSLHTLTAVFVCSFNTGQVSSMFA